MLLIILSNKYIKKILGFQVNKLFLLVLFSLVINTINANKTSDNIGFIKDSLKNQLELSEIESNSKKSIIDYQKLSYLMLKTEKWDSFNYYQKLLDKYHTTDTSLPLEYYKFTQRIENIYYQNIIKNTEEEALEREIISKQKRTVVIRNVFIVTLSLLTIAYIIPLYFLNKEKVRSEKLLLNILPKDAADSLKKQGFVEPKLFDHVTVMFTDFKDFTKYSEILSPNELVSELDYCFKQFDTIIAKYPIEKIKTIGDAYICASGLPISNPNHALDVISAAKEMQSFLKERRLEKAITNQLCFEMRVGIHSGSVIAGVVGSTKFVYDIWGDAVNLAARMEQSSEVNQINISEKTFELVKNDISCIHRGKISAKNKGEIDMYFVEI
jgi:class 3 adenylate cyclase